MVLSSIYHILQVDLNYTDCLFGYGFGGGSVSITGSGIMCNFTRVNRPLNQDIGSLNLSYIYFR